MRVECRASPEAEHTVWWLLLARAIEQRVRAAIEADRAGRGEPVAIVLKGSLDNLREYGHIGAPMFTPGNEPEQEWCVPLYTHPPAMRDSAREAMRTALEQLEHINRCIGLVTATIHYGSATWADTEAAIDALRAALGDE